jgi:phosphoglycerol transferase MdoB-like AlkP superfamily enzyme
VFRHNYFRFFGARKIGVLNYHLYEAEETIAHTLRPRTERDSRESSDAKALVAAWRPQATARSPLVGAARGKNLIMIMVESLQTFPMRGFSPAMPT